MAKTNKTETKATKPAQVGAKKKEGLRKPQVRILAFLAKQTKPVDRNVIAAGAPVDVAMCTEYLGSSDDAKRLANDTKHFPSLLTLGLIKKIEPKVIEGEPTGGTTYQITAAGKTAVVKAAKETK